jgi:RimJ/RimL family protein N-acetyltransferase
MIEKCDYCEKSGGIHTVTSDEERKQICAACCELINSNNSNKVWVRPMSKDDLELVLAWRSHPDIYQFFRDQTGPLAWSEHKKWFNTKPTTRDDFVIRYQNRRVGVISLDANNFVSVYIGEQNLWGDGIATRALYWLCQRYKSEVDEIKAEIHKNNEPSQHLFQKCGFQRTDDDDGDWLYYFFTNE